MTTKIEVATHVLKRMMADRGEKFIRTQASGGLQCAMGEYLKDEPDVGYITEATINLARRQLLRGHYGGR